MADDEKNDEVSDPRYENATFERLMNTNVAGDRKPQGQVGAVIVFHPDLTVVDVDELLETLGGAVVSRTIREFNPAYGGPVFYIP